jgi:hypothetical protein
MQTRCMKGTPMDKKTEPQKEQKPGRDDDEARRKEAEKWAFSPGLQAPR